ncbi:putative nuclease HARBI1 [Prorops nasuta]|uniref:putative nuclease HARBI1 n=1 Tax=Prorops nasuta TaxID=863751 RepID=UPI0034CD5A4C
MQPHNNEVDYYNRKGFHSVILQGVCDSSRRFIDVHIGVPGRVHDARVFRNSPIFKNIKYHSLLSSRNYLIGDSAYPLSSFLLVPYKDNGHLSQEQQRLNQRLSSTRSTIERTFALLKGKFRKLKYLEMSNISLINYAIASACILHNFILMKEGFADDDDYVIDEIEEEEQEDEDIFNAVDNIGHNRRNAIAQSLY